MSKGSLPTRIPARPAASVRSSMLTRTAEIARHRGTDALILASQVLLDAGSVALAFYLAYHPPVAAELLGPGFTVSAGRALGMLAITIPTMALVFALGGLYRLGRGVSRIDEFYKICTHASFGLVLAIAANSILLGHNAVFSRRLLLLGWILSITLITSGRLVHGYVAGQLRASGLARDRLLIVGTGKTGLMVFEKIQRTPQLGYEVAGFLSHGRDGEPVPRSVHGVPVYGTTEWIAEVVRRHDVDELILALEGVSHEEVLDLIYQIMDLPVSIKVYPDTFRLITNDELSIGDLGGVPMVTVRRARLRGWSRAVKRALDLVVSAAVLILLSPLLLLLAVLIKLDSPGPVFFVQERVGHDGIPFNLLKFRSMPVDAEEKTGPVFATRDDSRPTRLGRFMRRYSLDEVPQFINVFLGEMSLVGPRPERPYFVEQFSQTIPRYMARHREKAGITGWAQVNGLRGDTSVEERTHYDLYYVENWSLLFDVKIMIKTLLHVFSDQNAY